MKNKLLANITPGEILEEDFLKPMGLSQYRLAKDIGVPARRINEIVKGERVHHGGHGLAAGSFLQDVGAILVEPAIALRFGNHGGSAGPPIGT